MTYLEQLNSLLKKFTQSEISDLLGVTERTIQFWIAEENQKIPFQKAQRKIHELYTSLIKEGKTIEELTTAAEPVLAILRFKKSFPIDTSIIPSNFIFHITKISNSPSEPIM